MAGDWIKFEKATLDKPEVWAMADALAIDGDAVVGKLLRVWSWFDGNSTTGNVASVTDVTLMKRLDDLVKLPGFSAEMQKVGWLVGNALPNFERHNGQTAKNRVLTRERVANHREGLRNATTDTREEKRREEEKEPKALSGSKPDPVRARRLEAIEIGKRMIAYLNEKAGTNFQVTEVNVALARARILGEGATEADLRAVVDAKVLEWGADPEMRKYLRPGTLFNREKYAQYVGQLSSKLPTPEKKKRIGIFMKHTNGKLDGITQMFVPAASKPDHGVLAKDVYRRYGAQLPTTARYIVLELDEGERHTFSLEELR